MAKMYKTPGVYVEEISKFPPSVADVPTAIPAFIGYTADRKESDTPVPVRISSLLEYEAVFGKGPEISVESKISATTPPAAVIEKREFVLYDSIRLFYDNGGGICYIVSIGTYDTPVNDTEKFTGAITILEEIDEVTLLLFPDAATCLDGAEALASVQNQALQHCMKMGDRFVILDVQCSSDSEVDSVQAFRNNIGVNGLCYGAAYYPYLQTTYTKSFTIEDVYNYNEKINYIKNDELIFKIKDLIDGKPSEDVIEDAGDTLDEKTTELQSAKTNRVNAYNLLAKAKEAVAAAAEEGDIAKATETLEAAEEAVEVAKEIVKECEQAVEIAEKALKAARTVMQEWQLRVDALIPTIPGYTNILKELNSKVNLIPPSGAVAGVICAVDRYKGVWQSPANVSVSSVSGVSTLITDDKQENLNVDPEAGKSINAIRPFTGKGILVWGARTLSGNDSEWRYVSVRRLFNYIEESVKKSTSWAVFSPNDANTWIKIKSQIENFLNNLWRQGALAGSKAESAYYVAVGLNTTMSAQDILDGKLVIEIGLAAVRPAEFIILRFSHKLQE